MFRFHQIALVGLLGLACSCAMAQTQGTYEYNKGPVNPADGTFMRAYDNPHPILQLKLWRTSAGSDTLNVMKVWFWDVTIPVADVENVQLWKDDNANGKISAGETMLGLADLSGWETDYLLTFSGLSLDVDSTVVHLLVVLNLKPDHLPFKYIQTAMWWGSDPQYGIYDFTFAAGSTSVIEGGAWYFIGPFMITVPNYAALSLGNGFAVPAANAVRGSVGHPVLQFTLSPVGSAPAPTVTSITVRRDTAAGHTALPSDITGIRLYREYNGNGVVDDADTLLANGTIVGANFDYRFDFSTTLSSSASLLVVVDVAPAAGINRVFRVSVQSSEIVNNSIFQPGGTTKVTEDAQTIKAAASTQLAIAAGYQPTSTTAGAFLNSPTGIRVEARTGAGVVDTTFTSPIYAQVVSGPGAFTLNSQTAVQAAAGVAMFTNLGIDKVGTYTIRFVSAPLSPTAASSSFSISAGAAYRLVIIAQPQDGVVGANLPPPPVVEARDQFDNLATSFVSRVTASLISNPGSATLSNPQVFAVAGVATFPALQLNRPGAGYALLFNASGVAGTSASSVFTIVVGPPAQLVITQQPSNANGGQIMQPAPRAQVQDIGGNLLTGFVGNMDVAIGNNPSGGTLSGVTSVAVNNGVASFPGLSVNFAGTPYTLVFSVNAGALTVESSAFTISVGAAVKLTVVTQPSDTTGGMAFAPQPVVQIQDAGGNLISGDNTTIVTASITSGTGEAGSSLWGTKALAAVGGVVTYTDLAVTKAGPTAYMLTFSSNAGHAEAVSSTFYISLGPAARVGCSVQPGGASFGAAFLQQPKAQIQDLGGNLVASASGFITVAIKAGTGTAGATLSGVAGQPTTGGEASFSGLSIDFAGVDFVLVFGCAGLLDGESLPFNVASPGTQLGLLVGPASSQIGLTLPVQPVVEVRDANGTVFTADNFTRVTAEIAPSTGTPGALLLGVTEVYVVNGQAIFTNLQINTAGVGYRLKFTCYPALTPAFSPLFDVAGAPVRLKVTRQPVGANAGEPFAVQPRVEVADLNGVRCIGENSIVVNAYITPATGTAHAILGGTFPISVAAGVADFTDLSIDRPGSAYTLSFSSFPSMMPASTSGFEIVGSTTSSQTSDTQIVGGQNGGTCSGRTNEVAPWALLLIFVAAVSISRKLKVKTG